MFKFFKHFLASERGVAAIETALILPFLVLIFFGMVDLTALITNNRKITYASSVMADLVAQNRTSMLKSLTTDYYQAAYLIVDPLPENETRINLYGYRNVAGTVTQIWKTSNNQGTNCTATPSTAAMTPLMTAGNDIIVAMACTKYVPFVVTFLGTKVLGKPSFNVEQTIMLRPRSTTALTCYETVVGGATCS